MTCLSIRKAEIRKQHARCGALVLDLWPGQAADYGFMLWDGLSKGTLNNILNLLERGKKVVVYFSPQRACHTLRRISDLPPLLAECTREAMEEFEAKIELSVRITPAQPSLGLV